MMFLRLLLVLFVITATGTALQGQAAPIKLVQPVRVVRQSSPKTISTTLPRMSPDSRKQELRSILSRREFARSRVGLWDRFMAWLSGIIIRALGWLFGRMGDLSAASTALSVILTVIIGLLFILLVVHLIVRFTMGTRETRHTKSPDDLYAGPSSPKRAMDEAAQRASAGDFRSALRFVYLAVLLLLDEREMIRFDRTGTNWEYLAALKSYSELQNTLRPVTVTFDRKWYGREPATQDDYRAFVSVYSSVESGGTQE